MNKNLQSPLISQLHRLQGQLRGVEKLMLDQAKTSATLQQLEAVRGNLKSLEKSLLAEKIKKINDPEIKKSCDYLLKIS
ncbi:MAG: metal-sensing transcriptional repressor [Patescibacteria group bacterium]|jgi:DNA-binding FrmR family transcriptional regulator|nr:metal-sensing transcriptional repressor [Patescibacteria group bacterium]